MAKNVKQNKERNPRKISKTTTAKKGKGVKPRKLPKPSVLIVDDDKNFRESLAALFRYEDFEVVVKSTVETSIESIFKKSFDVIVLDMYMPEQEGKAIVSDAGLETTRSLRRYADTHKTAILVVLSGYPSIKDCFVTVDAGAYYMPKCVLDVDQHVVDICTELVQECRERLMSKQHKKKTLRPWLESHDSELLEKFGGQAVAVLDRETNTGNLKTISIGEYKVISAPTVAQLNEKILRDPLLRKAMPQVLEILKEKN